MPVSPPQMAWMALTRTMSWYSSGFRLFINSSESLFGGRAAKGQGGEDEGDRIRPPAANIEQREAGGDCSAGNSAVRTRGKR